jgi:Terminase large subunit, ATPase domain/Terminase large subunit, endonuclease domain
MADAAEAAAQYARWRADPALFIEQVLRDPETGGPFRLNAAERRFLAHAFKLDKTGRLAFPELLYSAPKKSGKTVFAAMLALYVTLVLGRRHAEAIIVANDLEQAQGRVFAAIKRMVELAPWLRRAASAITASRIEFRESRATITAIASEYASAAGSNANIAVFDELWGYTSERSRRLWDEMIPPPTRKIACRLTTTYAGFEGESALLEEIFRRGHKQKRIGPDMHAGDGLLMFWTHKPVAPWQTPEWLTQMRAQLRPNAYLRMIENQWVTTESSFVDMAWWDECVDAASFPATVDRDLDIWVGVDASVKRDSTALVAVTWDRQAKKVRLVWHRIFQPSANDPLDFERTVEATMLDLRHRFVVREVRFDPYQMQAVAQRLQRAGVRMVEFAQSVPNLTESSTCLYELIRGRALVAYSDEALRLAISRSIAIETTRGWRIAKEKASHKIDVVVALAMAALGAVQKGEPVEQVDIGLPVSVGAPAGWSIGMPVHGGLGGPGGMGFLGERGDGGTPHLGQPLTGGPRDRW